MKKPQWPWIEVSIVAAILIILAAMAIPSMLEAMRNNSPERNEVQVHFKKSRQVGDNIRQYDIEGHLYLASYPSGLIHAEHCPCKGKQ